MSERRAAAMATLANLGIDAERSEGGDRGGAPVAHEGAPVAFG